MRAVVLSFFLIVTAAPREKEVKRPFHLYSAGGVVVTEFFPNPPELPCKQKTEVVER